MVSLSRITSEPTVAEVDYYGAGFSRGAKTRFTSVGHPQTTRTINAQIAADSRSDEDTLAATLRSKWMKAIGLSAEEVAEYSNTLEYPASLEEEIENLAAMQRIVARKQQRRA